MKSDNEFARIVIDLNNNLAHADQKARLLFTLNLRDVGRPTVHQ
jgi:hypothetical protein